MVWQETRDAAKWAFEGAQNEEERRTRLAMSAMTNEAATDSKKTAAIAALGEAAWNVFKNS